MYFESEPLLSIPFTKEKHRFIPKWLYAYLECFQLLINKLFCEMLSMIIENKG